MPNEKKKKKKRRHGDCAARGVPTATLPLPATPGFARLQPIRQHHQRTYYGTCGSTYRHGATPLLRMHRAHAACAAFHTRRQDCDVAAWACRSVASDAGVLATRWLDALLPWLGGAATTRISEDASLPSISAFVCRAALWTRLHTAGVWTPHAWTRKLQTLLPSLLTISFCRDFVSCVVGVPCSYAPRTRLYIPPITLLPYITGTILY